MSLPHIRSVSVFLALLCVMTLQLPLASEALAREGALRRTQGKGLRLKARYRLARVRVKGATRKGIRKLRLPARYRGAKRKIAASKTGRTLARMGRGLVRARNSLGGRMTHCADACERKLPPLLARGFHRVREHNPLGLWSYTWKKFRQDPVFLGTYGGVSTGLNKLATPLMLGAGCGATASMFIPDLVTIPLSLAVITAREHHLRKDRSRTYGGTVRHMVQEYRDQTRERRQFYREVYAKERGRAFPVPALDLASPVKP